MKWLIESNSALARLARTVIQSIMGVIIANVDYFVGYITIEPMAKPIIVAIVMAILSPCMAFLNSGETEGDDPVE